MYTHVPGFQSFFSQSSHQQHKGYISSKPCHVGIHWIALAEYSQMSTHMPGFLSFVSCLHHFVLAKLATSSIRVTALQAGGNMRLCVGVACQCVILHHKDLLM